VPRGTWRCADGRWIAVSTSHETVARRVLDLIGLGDDQSLRSFAGRVAAREQIDGRMAAWMAERSSDEVLAAFEAAEAAAAPVYDMADIAADPHLRQREALVERDGVTMQGLVARLSATPGEVPPPGRPFAADQSILDAADPWSAAEAARRGDTS
jgi:crotonobetainyl-CoA:carnitine CoA-transferase CaiB-like acyl-CoA transferase